MTWLIWLAARATFELTLRGYLLPSINLTTGEVHGGCYDVVRAEMVEVTPC